MVGRLNQCWCMDRVRVQLPLPGATDIAFQLRITRILQRVNAANQLVIFKYCLSCRVGCCVRAQFADQRSQRGDNTIEIVFFVGNAFRRCVYAALLTHVRMD
ncbi:hypothetical protein D3C81_1389010 [compost metagenome]